VRQLALHVATAGFARVIAKLGCHKFEAIRHFVRRQILAKVRSKRIQLWNCWAIDDRYYEFSEFFIRCPDDQTRTDRWKCIQRSFDFGWMMTSSARSIRYK
jgi:hypothetical protein